MCGSGNETSGWPGSCTLKVSGDWLVFSVIPRFEEEEKGADFQHYFMHVFHYGGIPPLHILLIYFHAFLPPPPPL